jgi:hypothetical protein
MDMASYKEYLSGALEDYEYSQEKVEEALQAVLLSDRSVPHPPAPFPILGEGAGGEVETVSGLFPIGAVLE